MMPESALRVFITEQNSIITLLYNPIISRLIIAMLCREFPSDGRFGTALVRGVVGVLLAALPRRKGCPTWLNTCPDPVHFKYMGQRPRIMAAFCRILSTGHNP